MTTIRQIVIDAFREGGLTQVGVPPEADEFDEGLRKLKSYISSLYGNELGVPLTQVTYGDAGVTREGEDCSSEIDSYYVPSNVSIVARLEAPKTLYLSPNPTDGARIAVIDSGGSFATNNLIIDANGRQIDGASSVVLDTDGTNKKWFYRADLASWVEISGLTANSDSPFPEEFDDFLSTALAIRLNPRYQLQTAPETLNTFNKTKNKFVSRYSQTIEVRAEEALIRLPRTSYGDLSGTRFNKGLI